MKFEVEELEEFNFTETKMGKAGDKIVYFAVEDHEDVKEVYRKKAECRNDHVIVKSYIPPQWFARYSALGRISAE